MQENVQRTPEENLKGAEPQIDPYTLLANIQAKLVEKRNELANEQDPARRDLLAFKIAGFQKRYDDLLAEARGQMHADTKKAELSGYGAIDFDSQGLDRFHRDVRELTQEESAELEAKAARKSLGLL